MIKYTFFCFMLLFLNYRYCGRLICSSCSKNQLPHFNKSNQDIVRVGSLCYEKYKIYFPDFDLKVNRKNKSSYSISSTPKGAEYEINWDDDDTDSDSDDENNNNNNVSLHQRMMSAPTRNIQYHSSSSSTSITPTAATMKQLRKESQTARISAYKPNIKPKTNISNHTDSNSTNNNAINGGIGGVRYQAMIDTIQAKLNKERKQNLELQGQIEDLRAENQRLRKSKVDLMTWSNTEIAKYKKEIQFLKDKLKQKEKLSNFNEGQ